MSVINWPRHRWFSTPVTAPNANASRLRLSGCPWRSAAKPWRSNGHVAAPGSAGERAEEPLAVDFAAFVAPGCFMNPPETQQSSTSSQARLTTISGCNRWGTCGRRASNLGLRYPKVPWPMTGNPMILQTSSLRGVAWRKICSQCRRIRQQDQAFRDSFVGIA